MVRGDNIDGEGFVADGVEEDNHLVALVAHNGAFAPGLVNHLAVDGERLVARLLLNIQPGLTDIAEAAGTLIWLAEVVEQIGTAAGRLQLGIAAYHFDARLLE